MPPPFTHIAQRRVLIVGAGGLGLPVAVQLAHAGIAGIGLIDADRIDPSNLHRQLLYREPDIGELKVEVAKQRLARMFPSLCMETAPIRLTPATVAAWLPRYDAVVDATDSIASKYLINDASVLHGLPFTYAGVIGLTGQVLAVLPRQTACLRCVFPLPPAPGDIPTCQEAGVLGPVAGTVGIVEAAELVRLLGCGAAGGGRMLTYDAGADRWRAVVLRRNPACPLCGDAPSIHEIEPIADEPACTG